MATIFDSLKSLYAKLGGSDTNAETIAEIIEDITAVVGGGGEPEVWLASSEYEDSDWLRTFTLSNVGDADHMAELYTNAENYNVYVNGIQLPTFDRSALDNTAIWNLLDEEEMSIIHLAISEIHGTVEYDIEASTAPTSVKVSVKAE